MCIRDSGTSLLSLLDDLDHAPALVLGQGAGLHHLDGITDTALVVFIVGLELIGACLLYTSRCV